TKLGRQVMERMSKEEKVWTSATPKVGGCSPGDLSQTGCIGVRSDKQARWFPPSPTVRTTTVATSQIDMNAPLVGRQLGSDLSTASIGTPLAVTTRIRRYYREVGEESNLSWAPLI